MQTNLCSLASFLFTSLKKDVSHFVPNRLVFGFSKRKAQTDEACFLGDVHQQLGCLWVWFFPRPKPLALFLRSLTTPVISVNRDSFSVNISLRSICLFHSNDICCPSFKTKRVLNAADDPECLMCPQMTEHYWTPQSNVSNETSTNKTFQRTISAQVRTRRAARTRLL